MKMKMLIALALAALLPGAAAAGEDRDRRLRDALEALHQERFESALTGAQELRRLFPEDAAGPLLAANVHQTMMRDYRLRDREREFEAALAEGERLAGQALARSPSAEAFFARGTARGYRMLHAYRRGATVAALRGALGSVGDMKRALAHDPGQVDPLLGLALFDYWKAVKLPFGLFGNRSGAVERLLTVWSDGRFLGVDGAYALQTVLYREGDAAAAFEVNEWLYARYPTSPACLYHRALILEALQRTQDALAAWDALVAHIEASGRVSQGFLAECHLHRALLLRAGGSEAGARAALERARAHARSRVTAEEMEGPLEGSEQVLARIVALARELPRQEPPHPRVPSEG
jgi:hypothetical protein